MTRTLPPTRPGDEVPLAEPPVGEGEHGGVLRPGLRVQHRVQVDGGLPVVAVLHPQQLAALPAEDAESLPWEKKKKKKRPT